MIKERLELLFFFFRPILIKAGWGPWGDSDGDEKKERSSKREGVGGGGGGSPKRGWVSAWQIQTARGTIIQVVQTVVI